MQVKKKRSVFAQTFTMVFVVGWVAIFMYPTAWHLDMPDQIYRRFRFWEKTSLLVDDKIMPFADLLHQVTYPLHNAAMKSRVDRLIRMAPDAAALNKLDYFGQTPLSYAAMFGDINFLKTLLDAKADPNVLLHENRTALHYALTNQEEPTALLLLSNGARADLADAKGLTPLHLAIKFNLRDAFVASLKAETNLDAIDAAKLSPLDYAIKKNNYSMVIDLARAGAQPSFSMTPDDMNIKIFLAQWQKTGDFQQAIDFTSKSSRKLPPKALPAEFPVDLKPAKPFEKLGAPIPDENL